MQKIIVETTGDFMLYDRMGGNEVPCERPAVVTPSHIVETWIGNGRLKVVAGGLSSEATDGEFAAAYAGAKSKKEKDKAIDDFVKKFAETKPGREPEPEPGDKDEGGGKAKK